MNTKFNVYYSLFPVGPWTLANVTPVDRVDGLQSFTVSGLNTNTQYFLSIIGGELDSGGGFLPFISQPIGPVPEGAGDVTIVPGSPLIATTFSPNIVADDALGQQFEVL